jgi:hypothetical protein
MRIAVRPVNVSEGSPDLNSRNEPLPKIEDLWIRILMNLSGSRYTNISIEE